MKKIALLIGLLFTATACADLPQGRILSLDISTPDAQWSNSVSRGEAFYWRVDLQQRGASYTNERLYGVIRYASNATDSAGVEFTSVSSQLGRVWFDMTAVDSMGLTTNTSAYPQTYTADVILTNASGGTKYEWKKGVLTVNHRGGVSGVGVAAPGSTFYIANYTWVGAFSSANVPAVSATNVAWDNVTSKPSVWPGTATDSTARASIAVLETNTATAAQGALADTALQPTNVGALAGVTDMSGTGRRVFGTGLSVTNIDATAAGASQSGVNYGAQTIGANAHGASQSGRNNGTQTIGANAHGASQSGRNHGTQTIGEFAHGAQQRGYVDDGATATNNGIGAVQLLDLTAGQNALTTADGDGSILLGAGTANHRYSIVAGDGQVSHGDGSITAAGFWGDGSGLTGITAAQVGAVANTPAGIAAAGGVTNGAPVLAQTDLAAVSGTALSLTWSALTNAYDWTISAASTCTVGAATAGKDRWASLRVKNAATNAVTWSGINVWVTNGIRGATAPAAAADSMILINWRGTGVWAHAASTSTTVGGY